MLHLQHCFIKTIKYIEVTTVPISTEDVDADKVTGLHKRINSGAPVKNRSSSVQAKLVGWFISKPMTSASCQRPHVKTCRVCVYPLLQRDEFH